VGELVIEGVQEADEVGVDDLVSEAEDVLVWEEVRDDEIEGVCVTVAVTEAVSVAATEADAPGESDDVMVGVGTMRTHTLKFVSAMAVLFSENERVPNTMRVGPNQGTCAVIKRHVVWKPSIAGCADSAVRAKISSDSSVISESSIDWSKIEAVLSDLARPPAVSTKNDTET